MVCKMCGRNISNENANFCEYCGTSFRENDQPDNVNIQNQYHYSVDKKEAELEKEEPVSFWNWMKSIFLIYIPLVGPLIYIVMLIVWSFGSESTKSKKNWARAQLVFSIVSVILLIYYISFLINSSEFQEMFNSISKIQG